MCNQQVFRSAQEPIPELLLRVSVPDFPEEEVLGSGDPVAHDLNE